MMQSIDFDMKRLRVAEKQIKGKSRCGKDGKGDKEVRIQFDFPGLQIDVNIREVFNRLGRSKANFN